MLVASFPDDDEIFFSCVGTVADDLRALLFGGSTHFRPFVMDLWVARGEQQFTLHATPPSGA